MLDLHGYFNRQIYNRGMNYYQDKKVKNLISNGNIYIADVSGTKLYYVIIEINNYKIKKRSCTSPYVQEGYNCKHMAVVCILIDKKLDNKINKTENSKKDKIINLFFDNNSISQEYRYFDIEKITKNIIVFEKIYKKALVLLDKNEVTLDNFNITHGIIYQNQTEQIGEVKDSVHVGENKHKLNINLSKNDIINLICTNLDCKKITII